MAEQRVKARRPQVEDPDKEREAWIQLLRELVSEVDGWVKPDWSTREIDKEMQDSVLGSYSAPALLKQRAFTRVLLEPITRFAPGIDGVDGIYMMQEYDDIHRLYRVYGEWKIHFAFRGGNAAARIRDAEPLDLTRENFLRVLGAISGHAA